LICLWPTLVNGGADWCSLSTRKQKGLNFAQFVCLLVVSKRECSVCTRHLVARSSANIGKNSIGFAGSRAFILRTWGHRCPAPRALPWKKIPLHNWLSYELLFHYSLYYSLWKYMIQGLGIVDRDVFFLFIKPIWAVHCYALSNDHQLSSHNVFIRFSIIHHYLYQCQI
jgi:hypothetical protein